MWHDKLGVISIGVQNGGPDDGGLGDIKIDLWKAFVRYCKNSYCPSVVHYAIALRIDGEFQQFGPEAIEKIRRSKRDSSIGVDIVIPMTVWQGKSRNQLRDYLAIEVRLALKRCVDRLKKDKEQVDEKQLFLEFDTALREFTQIDYRDD